MEDPEIRRRELLRQTRRLYEEQDSIPAVHPRYGSIYHHLYGGEEKEEIHSGTFYLRLVLGILFFVFYVYMDQSSTKIAEVSSTTIIEQIGTDFDLSEQLSTDKI